MAAKLPEGGHKVGIKAHSGNLYQPHIIHPGLHHFIQYGIILLKSSHHTPLHMPACLRNMIVMSVLAILTAELLIFPPITYTISALETSGDRPALLLFILHRCKFFYSKYHPMHRGLQYPTEPFSFL